MAERRRGDFWANVHGIVSIAWPVAVLIFVPLWIRPVLPNVRDTLGRAFLLGALAVLPYAVAAAVGDWAFGTQGVIRNARTLLLTWVAFVLLTIEIAVAHYALTPRRG